MLPAENTLLSNKLKYIFKSSVSQERLKNLTMFGIENDICVEISIKQLIFTIINFKTGKILVCNKCSCNLNKNDILLKAFIVLYLN